MQALCWSGANKLSVNRIDDPAIVNPGDVIIRVHLSSVCGSDLHIISGYIPTMREGDVIGHEFMGEIVEVGRDVRQRRVGDRVVVPSPIGCGSCSYCKEDKWSLCDNSNPNETFLDTAFGVCTGAIYGYTHAFGGYSGSHAEYIRVPYADFNTIRIPEGVSDESALFCSDAFPTGYMGADFCDIKRGDIVVVWGCGGVGLMAIHSAFLLGAERVIAIDRFPDRLRLAEEKAGAEVINYELVDVHEALKELTGGRMPDACIDAVGMEAHDTGLEYLYDRTKQQAHIESDRPEVLRQAIYNCKKGGVVSIMGVYSGFVDKFPMGAAMNKALTLKTGQQFGQKYAPRLLQHIQNGDVDPSYLLTHKLPLSEGPRGYEMFKHKKAGCVRAVFDPRMIQ